MPDVTLKLTVGTFSVEVTGPSEYAEKKLEELVSRYLSSAKPSPSPPSEIQSAPLDQTTKRTSAAEFLKKTAHKNQRDRAMALGYYLEKISGQSSFTTSELGDLGTQAKHPFSNASDAVGKLVGRGLMMSAGEKDGMRAYALTATGEEYVESMIEAKS